MHTNVPAAICSVQQKLVIRELLAFLAAEVLQEVLGLH
jgi:hypothetical protein